MSNKRRNPNRKAKSLPLGNDKKDNCELSALKDQLEGLIPKEEKLEESLKVIAYFIEHKHEFPAIDTAMAEKLKGEENRRQQVVDTVEYGIKKLIRGYNFREGGKILIVALYVIAAIVGGFYLIFHGEYNLGASLLASPFLVAILGAMFKK